MSIMRELDLSGLKCPMPIVRLTRFIKELDVADEFTAIADDPAFCLDVKSWCKQTGHELVRFEELNERLVAVIRKREPESN